MLFAGLLSSTAAAAGAPELIVKLSPNATISDQNRILKNSAGVKTLLPARGRQANGLPATSPVKALSLEPGVTVAEELARLSQDKAVEYVEPNYRIKIDTSALEPVIPNDYEFPRMYALRNLGGDNQKADADIHATRAWAFSTGSTNVKVAVIDTGVDYFHQDLKANLWRNSLEIPANGIDDDGNGYVDDVIGYDFVSGDSDPFDDNNHGTHVSGIIGAVGNNGLGTVGVCWQVSLMALKAFDQDGNGAVSHAINAIHYAVNNGARIINASWGLDEKSRALEEAIEYAADAGVLVVAAAGNNKTDAPAYPAAFESVVAVGATDEKDGRAPFSNYGPWVDIAAPGANILSTLPENSYGPQSGTSMACPHVAGAAALVLSRFPDYNRAELRDIIVSSIDPMVFDNFMGNGRLNAEAAAQMDQPLPSVSLTVPKVISGSVPVIGSAHGRFLSGYSLRARVSQSPIITNWVEIASSTKPVTNGLLGTFDSSIVPDSNAALQLIATNSNGRVAVVSQSFKVLNAAITAPLSGDILRPAKFVVRGTVFGAGSTYSLSVGAGLRPTTFSEIAKGTGGELIDTPLGTWDASSATNGFYSLRLVVTNAAGLKTEFSAPGIYLDSNLKAGFPVALPTQPDFPISDWRNVRVADLDADGQAELVVIDPSTRATPQRLLVFRLDGSLAWSRDLGFDLAPDMPAIGDVDGDGMLEIFADGSSGIAGFRADGTPLGNGWPVASQTENHAKVLADLDADGTLELITFSQEYIGRQVQEERELAVFRANGELLKSWRLPWCGFTNEVQKIYPAVGKLVEGGGEVIVVPSGCNDIAAYKLGASEPIWRASLQGCLLSSPVIGDINGDGKAEVVVAAAIANNSSQGGIYVFDSNGQLWPGWPVLETVSFLSSPALADLDLDGKLDIIVPSAKPAALHVIQFDGFEADGWPRHPFDNASERAGVAVADVDGDGRSDVIIASPGSMSLALLQNNEAYIGGIQAWKHNGEMIGLGGTNSPIRTIPMEGTTNVRWNKSATPTVVDLDGNGRLELVTSSMQDRTYGTWAKFKERSSLTVWENPSPASAQAAEWPMFNHDLQNRGAYSLPLVRLPDPTNLVLAVRDRLLCREDSSLKIYPAANDWALNKQPLHVAGFTQPEHGTVRQEDDLALIYTPFTNYTGGDSFTYTIKDDAGNESSALIILEVKDTNDAPVANPLTITLGKNNFANIIYEASDTDKDTLNYRVVNPPKNGELWNYPALGVYYPKKGFVGADAFDYVANDGLNDSVPAAVSITIYETNNPPVLQGQNLLTKANRPLIISPSASDLDDDPVEFQITKSPEHGTAEMVTNTVIYTPVQDYIGPDEIGITAFDGAASSVQVMFKIEVIATNAPPVAKSSTATVKPGVTSPIQLYGVDPDGDPVTFTLASTPLHGVLSGEGPLMLYTPATNYIGPDRFSFTLSDGVLTSGTGVVSIVVSRANEAPKAQDGSIAISANAPVEIPLSLEDPEGDFLQTIILKGPAKGQLYGSGSKFTYVPRPGALGADRFTFKAWDGQKFGNVATVYITINAPPPQDAPVIGTISFSGEGLEIMVFNPSRLPVELQSSTNLVDWDSVAIVDSPGSEEATLRDTRDYQPERFYRVANLPR